MHQPRKFPSHTIFDWLPIFDYTTAEVFGEIAHAGQEPHQVYSMGFSRLSCVFCVNGRIDEHQKAAELRPELARKIAGLERELGKSYRLKQVKGLKLPKYFDEYLTTFCG
jgi:3'-phosphoadenosine 5'-phosphosulfate sulfotransferase (PAPS reductase)/FAD synthetase